MGTEGEDIRRISSASAVQWTFEILQLLYRTQSTLSASAANSYRKICRIQTQTNAQVILYRDLAVHNSTIFGNFCHDSIFSANFQSISKSNVTRCGHRRFEFAEYFGDHHFYVSGSLCRKATALLNSFIRSVRVFIRDRLLWFRRSTSRVQFIWFVTWIAVAGRQRTCLYSNRFLDTLEFLFILRVIFNWTNFICEPKKLIFFLIFLVQYTDDALDVFEWNFLVQVRIMKKIRRDFSFKICHFCCFRTRGMAAGIAAAVNYIMGFATIKTYYDLETSLSMPGVSLFYCVIATLGLILMFNILPETENRSLEDIELHFSDNSKKITDWYIPQKHEQRRNEIIKRV